MEEYNAEEIWNKTYLTEQNMAYPSEYVIRIFKGKYPTLNFNKNYNKKKICDLKNSLNFMKHLEYLLVEYIK